MMTMTDYAKARGISRQAVRKAILSGRLKDSIVQEEGRLRIDPLKADAEWASNTLGGHGPRPQPVASGGALSTRGIDIENYLAARAKKTAYDAELSRLDYEAKEGMLVPAADVKKQAFMVARMVRDAMLNIPDRIASELAAETDQFEIHRLLTVEIRRALGTALNMMPSASALAGHSAH